MEGASIQLPNSMSHGLSWEFKGFGALPLQLLITNDRHLTSYIRVNKADNNTCLFPG
jgi:hypothetical protein